MLRVITNLSGVSSMLALPSIVEDRIISSLSLPPLSDVQPQQTHDLDQDTEHVDDVSHEVYASLDGTAEEEYPRSNEDDVEGQNFEREIKEAIHHLETGAISEVVAESLPGAEMAIDDSELNNVEAGHVVCELAPAEEVIVTEQPQTVIPRVAHTKITQPLEVSYSLHRTDDEEEEEEIAPDSEQ